MITGNAASAETVQAVQQALGLGRRVGESYTEVRHGKIEVGKPITEFWSEARGLAVFASNGKIYKFKNHRFSTTDKEEAEALRNDPNYGGKKGDKDFDSKVGISYAFWEGGFPIGVTRKLDDFKSNLTTEKGHHEAIQEEEYA